MRLDASKEALPKPESIEALAKSFVHAANVSAVPKKVKRLAQDLGVVITLRLPFEMDTFFGKAITKGYYAYGRGNKEGVVFEVYIGYRSVTEDFPSRTVGDSIGRFMVRLVRYGYSIEGLEYKL